MNKYLRYYYIDTLLMIGLIILLYTLDFDGLIIYHNSDNITFYILPLIFSVSGLIITIILHISKFKFIENNLLFPKYYLIYFVIIVILAIVYNEFALIKGLHFTYYASFLLVGHAMLSVYTVLSFKKDEKKNK